MFLNSSVMNSWSSVPVCSLDAQCNKCKYLGNPFAIFWRPSQLKLLELWKLVWMSPTVWHCSWHCGPFSEKILDSLSPPPQFQWRYRNCRARGFWIHRLSVPVLANLGRHTDHRPTVPLWAQQLEGENINFLYIHCMSISQTLVKIAGIFFIYALHWNLKGLCYMGNKMNYFRPFSLQVSDGWINLANY